MAADVALAQSIGEGKSPATFRLFSWKPHAISIGYHQRLDVLDRQACARDGIQVVRRPTGGRAILHCDEITYSAIFPATSQLFDSRLLANYAKITRILKASLEPFSISFDQNVEVKTQQSYRASELCFAKVLSYELTVGGKKMVGSAQRRWPKVVLQHGSILLGPCHEQVGAYLNLPQEEREEQIRKLRASTTYVKKFLPQSISLGEFAHRVRHSFKTQYEIELEPGRLRPEEENACQKLRTSFRIS